MGEFLSSACRAKCSTSFASFVRRSIPCSPLASSAAKVRLNERADTRNWKSRPQRAPAAASVLRPATVVAVASAKCQSPAVELEILIRARYPIIYVISWEEERVEQYLSQIAQKRKKKLYLWSFTQGLVKQGPSRNARKESPESTSDPLAALDAVLEQIEPAIFLFKDFHPFMEENRSNLAVIRRLRDVAFKLRDTYKTICIVAPMLRMAPELSKDITVLELGLPSLDDFSRLLDRITEDVQDKPGVQIHLDTEGASARCAAQGLTLKEAENVFAKTLVRDGRLDGNDISVVLSEKKQIIRKSGLLEFYESQDSISQVAGLDSLKQWLTSADGVQHQAKEFGLPSPKGVLLLGMQGCGKSLCAKAISNMWRLPLLRFDVGRMFGSLVGSSEENVRRAIHVAESVAPAVLWIDEIDKAFAGATGSAGSDGGTASRVFGTLLTWLSEKTSAVFVVATANDVSSLPPELLRKGRLDEIFYVDLAATTRSAARYS